MTLYFVEYVLAIIISAFDNKRNRNIIVCLFVLFSFFFAFRDISISEGSDIDSYRMYYENINNSILADRFAFEPGYVLLNKFFHLLHLPFEALMISIGVFFCSMFWMASKRFEESAGLCLLPSLFLVFYYATGALRQSIAQVLFFYALFFLTKPEDGKKEMKFRLFSKKEHTISINNLRRYYILIVIAFLFHRTAIILLFLPIMFKRRNRVIIIAGAMAHGLLFPYIERIILAIPYIAGKYVAYSYAAKIESAGVPLLSFRLLEYVFLLVVLLMIRNKSANEETALILIEMGILIQVFLVGYIGATYRLLAYTDFGLILFAVGFYKRIKPKGLRAIYTLGIAFVILYRFYNLLSANSTFNIHYGLIGF